jgi:hypothetical protein
LGEGIHGAADGRGTALPQQSSPSRIAASGMREGWRRDRLNGLPTSSIPETTALVVLSAPVPAVQGRAIQGSLPPDAHSSRRPRGSRGRIPRHGHGGGGLARVQDGAAPAATISAHSAPSGARASTTSTEGSPERLLRMTARPEALRPCSSSAAMPFRSSAAAPVRRRTPSPVPPSRRWRESGPEPAEPLRAPGPKDSAGRGGSSKGSGEPMEALEGPYGLPGGRAPGLGHHVCHGFLPFPVVLRSLWAAAASGES